MATKYISPIDIDLAKKSKTLRGALGRLEKGLDKIVARTLTNPKRSAAFWNKAQRDVNKIYKQMNESYKKWTGKNLPVTYRESVRVNMKKLKKSAKAYNKTPKKNTIQLINSQYSKTVTKALVADSIRDFSTAASLGQKNVSRYLSAAQKATNQLWIEGTDITGGNLIAKLQADPTTKNLVNTMLNSRFVQVIDKNGVARNYKNKYYAEMVNRTKWHEAQSAAVRGVAANYDTDLIRVSAHNTTTEICQQYEGKVMSLTGKNKDFPIADQVSPYHISCLHFITPIFIESLRATGTEQAFKDFGRGKTNKPPFPSSFVPIKDRPEAA
jgi:hypothetical protein